MKNENCLPIAWHSDMMSNRRAAMGSKIGFDNLSQSIG